MHVTNGVDETTTLHWHGMHLPAATDGGPPHQMVEPGATWSPSWTIDQPAATLWYHPHLHAQTAAHVYRGAAGMFLIDDPAAAPDLPATYGVDDVPLILQDKRFDRDGDLVDDEPLVTTAGFPGDTIVVNGTVNPHPDVTTERTVLRSFAPDMGVPVMERFAGGDDTFDLVELRGADTLAPSPDLPDQPATIDAPEPGDADTTRRSPSAGRASTATAWTWTVSTSRCPPAPSRSG